MKNIVEQIHREFKTASDKYKIKTSIVEPARYADVGFYNNIFKFLFQ